MLEEYHEHLEHSWDSNKLQIIVKGIQPNKTYILLTNSVTLTFDATQQLEQTCTKCNKTLRSCIYKIKKDQNGLEHLKAEIENLKYCVVPFQNNICKVDQVLGYKSIFANRRTTIIANNLIINSQKKMGSEQINRDLYYTTVAQSLKELQSPQEVNNGTLSNSVVYSLQKDAEVMERYEIYVTKLQREIGENNTNKMFYQYAWSEIQIQYVMRKIQKYFGSVQSLLPRQRFLCFTFNKNKNDCLFRKKYDAIGKQLLLKDNIKIKGSIVNYFIVSKQQILQNQLQAAKLFLLPNHERILQMQIIKQWIVIAAETYLLFVHSERPMQFFHHEQDINPTQITMHLNGKIILVSDRRGFIYSFHIEATKIVPLTKYHVPFVMPYSLVHLDSGLAIAGIDLEENRKRQIRRSIFIVSIDSKQKRSKEQKINKTLSIQLRLQVVVGSPKQINKPINNIKSTKQKNVLACTSSNKFYLVSLEGYKLIQLELKSTICKMMPIPFMFNQLNFLMLTQSEEIIRVGIECYGQSLGAELNQVRQCKAKDCILLTGTNPKYEIYTCQSKSIDRVSYLDDSKHSFIKERNGKILRIASSKMGVAYLLDLAHSVQLKFLEV